MASLSLQLAQSSQVCGTARIQTRACVLAWDAPKDPETRIRGKGFSWGGGMIPKSTVKVYAFGGMFLFLFFLYGSLKQKEQCTGSQKGSLPLPGASMDFFNNCASPGTHFVWPDTQGPEPHPGIRPQGLPKWLLVYSQCCVTITTVDLIVVLSSPKETPYLITIIP